MSPPVTITMIHNKDRISQPSKGRFFAMSKGQVLHAIKTHSFKHSDYYKRVDIELRNPRSEGDMGQAVATLFPSEALILYSFPVEFCAPRARVLTLAALEELKRIDMGGDCRRDRTESISFRIYVGVNNTMRVTRKVRKATLGKYRGDAKFSTAFKPRKVESFEEILREIPMV